MAITLNRLVDHVTRLIGENADPRLDPVHIVNEAGRHLATMHDWQWRVRPPATVNFVANQDFIVLPSDLQDIESVSVPENVVRNVHLTSLQQVEQLRRSFNYTVNDYYVALVFADQSASTDESLPILEIYPTPGSSETAAVSVAYRAGWKTLTANHQAANVPSYVEPLLIAVVRAMAVYYRDNDMTQLESLSRSQMLQDAKRSDGMVQSNLGQAGGGMVYDPLGNSGRTYRLNQPVQY